MRKLLCLLMLVCFSLSSCCTMTRKTQQEVSISSEPTGAFITIDGSPYGMTPQSVTLKRKFAHTIVLEKEGYQTQSFNLKPRVSGQLASNALIPLGTTLAGAGVGLALTGATGGFAGVILVKAVIGGLLVGCCAGAIGTGVDLYSGASYNLSHQNIHAKLKACPPWNIQRNIQH